MDASQIDQIRRFNRDVTRSVGALDGSYLSRGRPLGEARLIFEIGPGGADLATLRTRLGLDSGYLSRMLRSLEAQSLVSVGKQVGDGRVRRAALTDKGLAEHAAYDELSDELAKSFLEPLPPASRERLVAAMAEVERLLGAAAIAVDEEPADTEAARQCLALYFKELDERFEEGFDIRKGGNMTDQDDFTPPKGSFVIARRDGQPIGCGGLRMIDAATAEIKRMWTAPAARDLGVAGRMLRKLEEVAANYGAERVCLDTNRALKVAQDLYKRSGYTEIERFNDNPYADHWFAKRL